MGLKTTWADTGANGTQNLIRVTSVMKTHFFHNRARDILGGAPPAGMGGGNDPLVGIIKQDRNAVGTESGQTKTGFFGNKSVGIGISGQRKVFQSILTGNMADMRTVHLMVFDQRGAGLSADGLLKTMKIFNHLLREIAAVGSQIQRVERGLRYTAQTGGKSVIRPLPLGIGAGKKSHAAAVETAKVDNTFLLELGNGNTLSYFNPK